MADTYKAVEVSAPGTLRGSDDRFRSPAPARYECGWKHVECVTRTRPQSRAAFQDLVCHAFLGMKWWAVSRPWVLG